ncbi:MAG TPA: sugar phosphate isomerase/epimerase [Puia sp.]
MSSRRNFLKLSAVTLTAPDVFTSLKNKNNFSSRKENTDKDFLQLGIAGYSFLDTTIEQSIVIMQRVGINTLSIKDFHLPLNSTQEKIDEVKSKFSAAGIAIYAVGVIYMKDENELNNAFDYAKKVGVNLIVCAPNYDLLPQLERQSRTYNIRAAIHNHGPEDKLYPGPKDVYDRIKNLDNRIGLCLDIGHAMRAGVNPAKAVADYGSRIFDMHIKDVSAAVNEGKSIEVGRGIIDYISLLKELKKIKYSGKCSFEYENLMKDPLPGIAESEGFFRGVERVIE